jgi:hypothetical protein
MPELEIVRLAAHRQAKQLVAQADAEHRLFAYQLADIGHLRGQRFGIARTDGEENAIGFQIQDVFRRGERWDHGDAAAHLPEAAQDVALDAEIVRHHVQAALRPRRLRGGLLQVMVVSMYIVSGISGSKAADVAAVQGADTGGTVWNLLEALRRKDREGSLRFLGKVLDAGDPPLKVLGFLGACWRQEWKSRRFSEEMLRDFEQFREADSRLKGGGGRGKDRLVMERMILNLCRGAARPMPGPRPFAPAR